MYNNNFNPYFQPNLMGTAVNNNNYSNNLSGDFRTQVVRVNGKNGAEAYRLPPNSSILLLDESAPIVWLKTTDGAGYATLMPYDIVPHQDETQVNNKLLEERIKKLEDIVNELSTKSNVESTKGYITKSVVTSTK